MKFSKKAVQYKKKEEKKSLGSKSFIQLGTKIQFYIRKVPCLNHGKFSNSFIYSSESAISQTYFD